MVTVRGGKHRGFGWGAYAVGVVFEVALPITQAAEERVVARLVGDLQLAPADLALVRLCGGLTAGSLREELAPRQTPM